MESHTTEPGVGARSKDGRETAQWVAKQAGQLASDRGVKPGFMTSEFLSSMIVAIGILIAAAAADNFQADEAWPVIAALSIGYMISRGLAKAGIRGGSGSPAEDGFAGRIR